MRVTAVAADKRSSSGARPARCVRETRARGTLRHLARQRRQLTAAAGVGGRVGNRRKRQGSPACGCDAAWPALPATAGADAAAPKHEAAAQACMMPPAALLVRQKLLPSTARVQRRKAAASAASRSVSHPWIKRMRRSNGHIVERAPHLALGPPNEAAARAAAQHPRSRKRPAHKRALERAAAHRAVQRHKPTTRKLLTAP
jgi:hypothetical protein